MKTCKCGRTISEKQARFTLFHRGGEKCSKCSEKWVKENRPEELAKVINNWGTTRRQISKGYFVDDMVDFKLKEKKGGLT